MQRQTSSRLDRQDTPFIIPRVQLTTTDVKSGTQGMLPWWQSETRSGLEESVFRLSAQHAESKHLPEYKRASAILTVYTSNQSEHTLPRGFTAARTFQLLESLESIRADEAQRTHGGTSTVWFEEGGRDQFEARAQLLQHMRALRLLCIDELTTPLDTDLLLKAHAILMDGAVTAQGARLVPGYRQHGASAGTGHVYMQPQHVPAAVTRCLQKSASALATSPSAVQGVHLAAELFYELIHCIHPFANGNGRLGKLLVARVLMQAGAPFPVPLLNGHSRPQKHFQDVVLHYDRTGVPERFELFVLECLHYRWKDFAKYTTALDM